MIAEKIIKETIEAYAGYPDRIQLSRETQRIIGNLDIEQSSAIYNLLQKHESLSIDPRALEKFTLALGHFQAINKKKVLSKDIIPQSAINMLTDSKFIKCYKIASAAGRAWNVLLKDIVGLSPAIKDAKKQVWHACFGKELISSLILQQAIKDLNVLILGETGTGKELFAKVIQNAAFWHDGGDIAPTASANVAAFQETLIESELFGHVKGAYTGAAKDRDGLILRSNGGTLFLDEIGDLPSAFQVKFLRVIETKRIAKLGSDKEEEADVRYISATSKNIQTEKFRVDLYERLAGTVVQLPALRDRSQNDIEEIAKFIIRKYLDEPDKFNDYNEVLEHVHKRKREGYLWPGNVRELQSYIRGRLLGINNHKRFGGMSSGANIPPELQKGQWSEAEVKDWYFNHVYQLNNYNKAKTANILCIDPSTLQRRGKKNEHTS
jgi:transcriptional regulator with PAS, ATPase and Fis domain